MAWGQSLSHGRVPPRDKTGTHQHNHRHSHLHSHLHSRHPETGDNTDHHIRSHATPEQDQQQPPQRHRRDEEDLDSSLTEVVATVSVVQVVNESGVAIETQTYRPDTTPTIDSATPVETTAGSGLDQTSGAPTVDSSASTAAAVSGLGDDADPASTTSLLSSISASLSALSDPGTVTSAPLSTFTSFPTLSGSYNSTSRPFFFNSSSFHSLFANATPTSTHSNSTTSITFLTTTTSSHRTLSTDESDFSIAGDADVTANVGAGGTTSLSPTSTSTATSSSSGALDPTTSSVIGGVVGGVAGIALVAVALMMLLKWKRAQGNGIKLLGDGPQGRRSLFSNRGGPSGGGGGGMTDSSGGTFDIPAALASLSAYKQPPQPQLAIEGSPESSDKGFYRVSGRKLVSVLESGGDGYADPPPGSRESRLSVGTSADNRLSTATTDNRLSGASFWRPDSMAFLSSTNNPLQLGSPMRPESGIMIMRDGPGRTPLQEEGPIFDNALSPSPSPSINTDPLGRSLLPQSGSHVSAASASRFHEGV